MLVWLNWATTVAVVSEPVQPRWTSLLEVLLCRTAPVSISDGLKVICLFFFPFLFCQSWVCCERWVKAIEKCLYCDVEIYRSRPRPALLYLCTALITSVQFSAGCVVPGTPSQHTWTPFYARVKQQRGFVRPCNPLPSGHTGELGSWAAVSLLSAM